MIRRFLIIACTASLFATLAVSNAAANEPLSLGSYPGGSGDIAGRHSDNLCREHHIEPGGHRAVHLSSNYDDAKGTLFCAPWLWVWKATIGPWEGGNWISIRCPADERPVSGGAGYSSPPILSQAGGSFGYHKDGYWHYRFYNHDILVDVSIQFWAVCIDRHSF